MLVENFSRINFFFFASHINREDKPRESLNNLGNNLGSMIESAINCQPDGHGAIFNGDETTDLEYDGGGNSCSEFSVEIGASKETDDRSEEPIISTPATTTTDNSDNSDNRVINHLDDEFETKLDSQNGATVNLCDSQNNIVNTINEDCDNLIEADASKNSEDCNRMVDELEPRLNGDTSVETSVETIVDNNYAINSINDKENK